MWQDGRMIFGADMRALTRDETLVMVPGQRWQPLSR